MCLFSMCHNGIPVYSWRGVEARGRVPSTAACLQPRGRASPSQQVAYALRHPLRLSRVLHSFVPGFWFQDPACNMGAIMFNARGYFVRGFIGENYGV